MGQHQQRSPRGLILEDAGWAGVAMPPGEGHFCPALGMAQVVEEPNVHVVVEEAEGRKK